ncbi:MAG: hypothetical protein ACRDH6_08830 [Actinomycetota bacterium]
MPRWVKVFVIIGIVLVVGFIVTLIAGVEHGPSLHTPPDGGHTPPVEHGP